MDEFISRGISKGQRQRRVTLEQHTAVSPWFASSNLSSKPTTTDNRSVAVFTERATFAMADKKKKKKRRPRESGSGSESYSSSSESDGEGNRRSKKKKGRCWKGYEPVPGKAPYSEGSCRKK